MTHQSIALIGKKRSGKGSVASILSRHYGHEVLSFADPLRELLAAINPRVWNYLHYADVVELVGYEQAKDDFPEVRQMLKNVGQGVREVLGQDVWVDNLIERMTMQMTFGFAGPWVVDDCRRVNEVEALRYHDFLVVRVVRPGLEDDVDTHITETDLDGYEPHMTVVNDGDLDDLDREVRILLSDTAYL